MIGCKSWAALGALVLVGIAGAACITVEKGDDPGAAALDAGADAALVANDSAPTPDSGVGSGVDSGPCVARIAGPNSPSSVRQEAAGTRDWNNLNNAKVIDTNAATAALNRGETSYALLFEGFGFQIPAAARITGVEFTIARKSGELKLTTTRDVRAQPFPGLAGRDSPNPNSWPTSLGTVTYGGNGDTFGLALTPSTVNGGDFAMALAVSFVDSDAAINNTVHVDGASARVFYCE
jgi:hypothetical protein